MLVIELVSPPPPSATPRRHQCLCQEQRCRRRDPQVFVFNDQVLVLCQLGLMADGNIYTQWIASSYEIQAPGKQTVLKITQRSKGHKHQPNAVLKLSVRNVFDSMRNGVTHQGRSPHKEGRKPILLGFWCKDKFPKVHVKGLEISPPSSCHQQAHTSSVFRTLEWFP